MGYSTNQFRSMLIRVYFNFYFILILQKFHHWNNRGIVKNESSWLILFVMLFYQTYPLYFYQQSASYQNAYYTQAELEDTNQFHNFHAILG